MPRKWFRRDLGDPNTLRHVLPTSCRDEGRGSACQQTRQRSLRKYLNFVGAYSPLRQDVQIGARRRGRRWCAAPDGVAAQACNEKAHGDQRPGKCSRQHDGLQAMHRQCLKILSRMIQYRSARAWPGWRRLCPLLPHHERRRRERAPLRARCGDVKESSSTGWNRPRGAAPPQAENALGPPRAESVCARRGRSRPAIAGVDRAIRPPHRRRSARFEIDEAAELRQSPPRMVGPRRALPLAADSDLSSATATCARCARTSPALRTAYGSAQTGRGGPPWRALQSVDVTVDLTRGARARLQTRAHPRGTVTQRARLGFDTASGSNSTNALPPRTQGAP